MVIKEIEVIRKMVPTEEILLQLAEEANELAVAMINRKNRLLHIYHKDSNFIEEIANVRLCIDVLGDKFLPIPKTNAVYNKAEINDILIKNCNKISKYAIKLRRCIRSDVNPTPETFDNIKSKLINAISKVETCINNIGDYWNCDKAFKIYKEKANRWIVRLIKIQEK